jgi:hypothetical protein
MYQTIKRDIQDIYYQQNFSNEGERFVAWYLRNIHLCDPNETRYNITDGADDKQIDAIVIDEENSQVNIIQGKFIGETSVDVKPLQEVLSAWVQLKNLVKLQETANLKLKKRLVDLGNAIDDDYEIIFELITTGTLTKSAKLALNAFQDQIAKDEDLNDSLIVINNEELKNRYDQALGIIKPSIFHELDLEPNNFASIMIGGTHAIIAAIPLKECLNFPGIPDGRLFQKNVRQSLGISNRVNKSIKKTIYEGKHSDFFFYHNGITAICNKMELKNNHLILSGLNVVNGCQSLNTIHSCSERVKELDDACILFRFYEIPESHRERADMISISTNFQTAVKARDLRSNDKRVLQLKKAFEQKYSQGFFITKRGEEAPASKDKRYVVSLVDLGKYLITWQSQRPIFAYSETKIFDKYFDQLFKRDYDYNPENIQALNSWMQELSKGWIESNPYALNESLLAMKSYARFHQLYAISQCFSLGSNLPDKVPQPSAAFQRAESQKITEKIIQISANSLNFALQTALEESQSSTKVFSPQNWLRTKSSLKGINAAISMQLMMLPSMLGGAEIKKSLVLPSEFFDYRWQAD